MHPTSSYDREHGAKLWSTLGFVRSALLKISYNKSAIDRGKLSFLNETSLSSPLTLVATALVEASLEVDCSGHPWGLLSVKRAEGFMTTRKMGMWDPDGWCACDFFRQREFS